MPARPVVKLRFTAVLPAIDAARLTIAPPMLAGSMIPTFVCPCHRPRSRRAMARVATSALPNESDGF